MVVISAKTAAITNGGSPKNGPQPPRRATQPRPTFISPWPNIIRSWRGALRWAPGPRSISLRRFEPILRRGLEILPVEVKVARLELGLLYQLFPVSNRNHPLGAGDEAVLFQLHQSVVELGAPPADRLRLRLSAAAMPTLTGGSGRTNLKWG